MKKKHLTKPSQQRTKRDTRQLLLWNLSVYEPSPQDVFHELLGRYVTIFGFPFPRQTQAPTTLKVHLLPFSDEEASTDQPDLASRQMVVFDSRSRSIPYLQVKNGKQVVIRTEVKTSTGVILAKAINLCFISGDNP